MHLCPVGPHRIGMSGCRLVLATGQGGLADQGSESGIVSGLVEMKQLFVDDGDLGTQSAKASPDLGQPPLDLSLRHPPESTWPPAVVPC